MNNFYFRILSNFLGSLQNFERHNSVIEIYNQAAAELMAELNVRVNDLYKISEAFNEEYYSDWVHPNYLGSRLLAEQVVRFLKL